MGMFSESLLPFALPRKMLVSLLLLFSSINDVKASYICFLTPCPSDVFVHWNPVTRPNKQYENPTFKYQLHKKQPTSISIDVDLLTVNPPPSGGQKNHGKILLFFLSQGDVFLRADWLGRRVESTCLKTTPKGVLEWGDKNRTHVILGKMELIPLQSASDS